MVCAGPRARRTRRPRRHAAPSPASVPLAVTAFRRDDNTVCHGRCGRPLSLQGVRGLLEADFYCYACLAHVTLPLVVLGSLPLGRPAPALAAH